MHARSRFYSMVTALALAALVISVSGCAGKRAQGEDFPGYSGKKWEDDFGVLEGHCNRQAVGAALGGLVGGVIGAQVGGEGNDRRIAIAIGSLAGAFIGSRIGRDMDQADRACVGHALELAGDQKRVTWTGADGRTTYRLTPVRAFEHNGASCREFDLGVTSAERQETRRAKACPVGDGNWRIVG
jgi:surface antigen